jgi:hypothetical protein
MQRHQGGSDTEVTPLHDQGRVKVFTQKNQIKWGRRTRLNNDASKEENGTRGRHRRRHKTSKARLSPEHSEFHTAVTPEEDF